jgi:arylsulfatase A-like enzyme
MLDIEPPESMEGESLLPCIEDNAVVREQLFFAYRDVQRSIKEGDYKLIEYVVLNTSMYLPKERRGEFITTTQLFNIKEDPLEMNNLAEDPNYKTLLNDLREKLRKYSEKINDDGEMGQTFWTHYDPE